MAGFICDLCGGQITMQANKTGVCKECGMEYDIEAIRAKMGAASKPVSAPAPVISGGNNNEVDREALLVYLNDVRVMETVISEDTALSHRIAAKERKLVFSETPPRRPEKPEYESFPKGLLILGIILLPAMGLGLLLIITYFKEKKIAESKAMFKNAVYEHELKSYLKKQDEYDREKARSERELPSRRLELQKHQKNVTAEIATYKKILQTAYDANIIPMQFRNIQGVYYLYDYLSTSNQTLSEALMQCNLEAIKQKLDKMIQLQSEQIVQQAQANAKLGKIYEVSVDTMNNTAVAAKYAQIAAVNSEVTKKLAASSLAYQKADFWLK